MNNDNGKKECCKNPENLELQPSNKSELKILKCKVCKCRHFELTVEAGVIGVAGAKL